MITQMFMGGPPQTHLGRISKGVGLINPPPPPELSEVCQRGFIMRSSKEKEKEKGKEKGESPKKLHFPKKYPAKS